MREELMEAINRDIYRKFGMSYEDFSKLSYDEQQRIIHNYHKKNKRKKENLIMIGSGEHAVFLKKVI